MTTFRVSSAAFLLSLVPAFAFAQSGVTDPAVPGSGYRLPEVVQAQHSGRCGEEVAKLRDNVLLRMSRPGNGNDSLGQQNAYLEAADEAAAAGHKRTVSTGATDTTRSASSISPGWPHGRPGAPR